VRNSIIIIIIIIRIRIIINSEEELQKQIQLKTFSDDTHMVFGLENVPRMHLKEKTISLAKFGD
jgi:hypothetical protein